MPTQRRTSRRHQFGVLDEESQIEEERKQLSYGSARVDIDALAFDASPERQANERNIERLLSAFQRAGCLRLHPQYHVPAIIAKEQLDEAVANTAASEDALLHHDPSKWPILIFPDGFRVQCLHGRHRIEAAKRYLSVNDRWWVVDFYSPDSSAKLRAKLVRQNLNEQPPIVGDVFFHILKCDPTDTATINFWWSQVHSKDEIRELQRLLKRPSLAEAFRKVAQIPAFGRELLPGNVGSLLRLKCDEEIVHYLLHTCNAWAQLLENVPAAQQRVDPTTVATVRSRNIRYCRTDHDFLEPLVRRGTIFGNFQASERQVVWRNMKKFPGRVPSLAVFFEDFKYLEDVAACVKTLFDFPRGQTVFQVLNQSFVSFEPPVLLRRPSSSGDTSRPSRAVRFDIARRRLFLCAMRLLESLRPGSVLMEQDGVKLIVEATSQAQHQLAKEADRLGFRSAKINTMLSEDPDRSEARRSLLRARDPQHFVYDPVMFEWLVDRLVAAYAEARQVEPDPRSTVFVTDGSGECLKRRCGRPYQRAFAESATSMTLEKMHTDENLGFGELTSLFVRRDVYLAFFGPLDLEHLNPHNGPQEAETTLGVTLGDHGSILSSEMAGREPHSDLLSLTFDHDTPDDPRPNEGNGMVIFRPHQAEPYSPSQYSQSLDEYNDALITDVTVVPETEQNTARIAFVLLERDEKRMVGLILVDEHVQFAVEEFVGRYAEQGYYPFDSSFHVLAPHQCVRAAMEETDKTLLLIHEDDVRVQNFRALDSQSRKRRASEELNARPRKLHIVDPQH